MLYEWENEYHLCKQNERFGIDPNIFCQYEWPGKVYTLRGLMNRVEQIGTDDIYFNVDGNIEAILRRHDREFKEKNGKQSKEGI